MTAEEMHAQLMEVGRKLGLPKHWELDLIEHDLAALQDMQTKGLTKFWWRLRQCGTQFSSHSEAYARLGWDAEQDHCYAGDLATGSLKLLPTPIRPGVRK
jgi:hypothetical protein